MWLGIDHNFTAEDPPLVFETMVFPSQGKPIDVRGLLGGGPNAQAAAAWREQECWRWPTESAACAEGQRQRVCGGASCLGAVVLSEPYSGLDQDCFHKVARQR